MMANTLDVYVEQYGSIDLQQNGNLSYGILGHTVEPSIQQGYSILILLRMLLFSIEYYFVS